MQTQDVMVQEQVAEVPTFVPVPTFQYHPLFNKSEMIAVLERAANDDHFIGELTDRGPEVLDGYDLTREERAALLTGDIRWIEKRVGKLNEEQRTWLNCKLQQEAW